MNEWDHAGGLDETAANAPHERHARGPMVGEIKSVSLHGGLAIETTLDPAVQPFLYDHKIDGTPVLPGVMGIEAFAEAATQLCPGWRLEAVEEVNFLAPFKFYRSEPRVLSIEAAIHQQHDSLLADCRLIGRRQIPNQKEPQATTHFTARVRLTQKMAERMTSPAPILREGAVIERADIYRVYFHGPAYQVVQRAWLDGNCIVGEFAEHLPHNHEPSEQATLMVPRLIELCFQTAGLWELGVQGRFGLPHYIREVCLWNAPPTDKLYAVVTADPEHGSFDAEVLDAAGVQYLRLTGYRTIALSQAVDPEALKALQHALSLQPV